MLVGSQARGPTAQSPRGTVAAIARYPVKSLGGEELRWAAVERRGLRGDRLWSVRDADGKFGSGKSTRRFRRMPGLLDLTAHYEHDLVPTVSFPDGRQMRADGAEINGALSAHVGRPVTLGQEGTMSHFDEGPLHLMTTSALARLSDLHGTPVDPRRFRANLIVDTDQDARFDEDDWVGRELSLGSEVRVRLREPMVRCVMVGLPQRDLAADGQLLNTIARVNDTWLGLVVDVLTPGTLRVGDEVVAHECES